MRREVRYFVSALVRYFSSLRSSVRNTFDVGRWMLDLSTVLSAVGIAKVEGIAKVDV